MRILILGASGMLGHQLWRTCSVRFPQTYAVLRRSRNEYAGHGLFQEAKRVIEGVDAMDLAGLEAVLDKVRPDVVLNCIGVTKRREEANDLTVSTHLNARLPHWLADWGGKHNARVLIFSTDCVFDGRQGGYLEESLTSAQDIYGRTKAEGEVRRGNVLTLRSSFIGPELGQGSELLEWFLGQSGVVKGFKNAIYSGLTTYELCRVVEKILVEYPNASGLYNVSSDPISKLELLMLIRKKMDLAVEIVPEDGFHCDRSLDSSRFRKEFNYSPPSWETMIDELAKELKGRKK